MKSLLLGAALMLALLVPKVSHADFNRICRGASLLQYDKEIKQAVKKQLSDANIAFRRVDVSYSQIVRPRDRYVNDFASDLTVGSGASPAVSFTGAFPAVTTCDITLDVRILVVYPDGSKSITVTPTTVQGTLLKPLNLKRTPEDD